MSAQSPQSDPPPAAAPIQGSLHPSNPQTPPILSHSAQNPQSATPPASAAAPIQESLHPSNPQPPPILSPSAQIPQPATPPAPVAAPDQGSPTLPSPAHTAPVLPPPAPPQKVYTLPEAPTFNRFQEYNHAYKVTLAGFSYSIEKSGKRGCVRCEVEQARRRQLLISVGCLFLERKVESLTLPDGATSSKRQRTFGFDVKPTFMSDRVVEIDRAADGTEDRRVFNSYGTAENINQYVVETSTAADGTVTVKESVNISEAYPAVGASSAGGGNSQWREYSMQGGQPEHATLKCKYVVVGLFSRINGVPRERLIEIKKSKRLFFYIWWAIISLRGMDAIFSLKDVRGFAIYKCDPYLPLHQKVTVDPLGEQALAQMYQAYSSWRRPHGIEEAWVNWIDSALNSASNDPTSGEMLSIEVVLGWSTARISVIVLAPVLLSLGVGFWLNSRNWGDATTIQTAWSVASYIATAGAFLGALLGVLSGISEK